LKQGKDIYSFSPFLFNIVLEDFDSSVRQENKIESMKTGKEEIKLLLF
jgi:hypothetical protein